ncbi:MAG: phage portal protein [bacterium]
MTDEKEARQTLRAVRKKKSKDVIDFGSRQTNPEEGMFKTAQLKRHSLIAPPYDPFKLYRIVESSAMLGSCIETMIDNVHGFGYELQYLGDKEHSKDKVILNERQNLNDFFKQVNETQSIVRLKKEVGRDYETTGNGYIEVVSYPDGEISTLYRADSRYIRLQVKQDKEIPITVDFIRNGRLRRTTIYKRFRRFAMITNTRQDKIKWFKEYGDPRRMCAISGKYEDELEKGEEIQEEASEIIHLKQGNDTYGIPRWVGVSSTVLGVRNADYINYDLFENQAIPPLAILVSGGRLTSESIQDIIDVLENRKGVENFHKIAVLEAESGEGGELTDKATGAKIDFKPLPQQNDILFANYIETSEKRIRSKFRLPPMHTGQVEDFSRSTSDSSKLIAEEQVFRPERNDFDEAINFTLMKGLGAKNWSFRTTGPRLIEGPELIDAIGKFSRAGALTINSAIKMMNRVLDLDMPTFDESWGDYPAALVLQLAKQRIPVGMESGFTEMVKNLEKTIEKTEDADVAKELAEIKQALEYINENLDDAIDTRGLFEE